MVVIDDVIDRIVEKKVLRNSNIVVAVADAAVDVVPDKY